MGKWVILIVTATIVMLLLVTELNEKRASRYDAQARLVTAQGQNRLDSAQAFSVIMLTALPYVVIVVIMGLVVSVFFMVMAKPVPNIADKTVHHHHTLIEKHYIIIPFNGTSTKEYYNRLADKMKVLNE